MAQKSMMMQVNPEAPVLSAKIPAVRAPMIPPISKGTDMYAENSGLKLVECLMYMGSQ